VNIEFYKHDIRTNDIASVTNVLRSLFLTTGEQVHEFENKFSKYLGCKYTAGVSSCTAALHLSLLASGIGAGDEVITTPMTFIATANSIIYTAAKPVFVDVEPETGNINADLIEAGITQRTKAILPVHLHGQMCDMQKIRSIADKHGLVVIEDAAHAIEAIRDGSRPAKLSDAACFSFYATKNITSGEGGAVSTNNKQIAEKLIKLRLHGMSKGAAERYSKKYEHWDMEMLGWKYNMDDIQAALLMGQLERIEQNWERRELICREYENAFKNNPQISLLKVISGSKSARHMFTIQVAPERRDYVLWELQKRGVGVAVHYRAIHLLSYYRQTFGYKRGMFPVAEKMGDSTITLPLYPKLKDKEIAYVIKTVNQLII
jgi:dTDP-4-amino-4,6-dideoxygalactose transaminase